LDQWVKGERPKSLPAPRPSALVIEDESIQARVTASVLRRIGFEPVQVANSADQALELFNQHGQDFLVVDLCLPDMDGVELIGKIRSGYRGSRARVMAYTADDHKDRHAAALRAGANDFYSKGEPPDVIAAKFASVLHELRTDSENTQRLQRVEVACALCVQIAQRATEGIELVDGRVNSLRLEMQPLNQLAAAMDPQTVQTLVEVATRVNQGRAVLGLLDWARTHVWAIAAAISAAGGGVFGLGFAAAKWLPWGGS
jgi:CheY-like chemotaxis protein